MKDDKQHAQDFVNLSTEISNLEGRRKEVLEQLRSVENQLEGKKGNLTNVKEKLSHYVKRSCPVKLYKTNDERIVVVVLEDKDCSITIQEPQ